MPAPPAATNRLAALDGLRAGAVVLVLAYHGGVPGLRQAGYFGVDVFFVLSGFLITRLLLAEVSSRGGIAFAGFWGRRARRLVPALVVMLAAASAYAAYLAPSGRYPGFRADALSVLAYTSNWHFIQQSSNYFSATGIPSLLTHTWSLAIEEQFYVVWPIVLWVAVRLARRVSSRNPAGLVLVLSGGGALASAGWMAYLYRSGGSASRLYYGTDTHAQSILVGGALAALMSVYTLRPSRRTATGVAVLAASGLGWAACSLGSAGPWTYEGGFLAVSLLTAALVAVTVSDDSSPPSRVLALPPVAYVGRISYGMYLWYFPLFEVIDHGATGLSGPALFLIRCAADVAAAALSYHLIEVPARRRTPPRLRRAWSGSRALAGAGTAAIVLGAFVLTEGPAGYPSPATATPLMAPDPGGAGQRILVFGDSTAATLADDLALSPEARQHRVVIEEAAMFGCGLVGSTAVEIHGQPTTPPAGCRASSPAAGRWPALLRVALARYRPAVVLVAAGRWEVESRQAAPAGAWSDITDPADASYVRSQLELAASAVTSGGARPAFATAPCYSSGEQPNGDAWPEDGAARLDAYNALVRQTVAASAGAVLVDLDAIVCPAGRFRSVIDGVTVRAPDGVHYPYFDWRRGNQAAPDTVYQAQAFGAWIGPKVLDPLAAG